MKGVKDFNYTSLLSFSLGFKEIIDTYKIEFIFKMKLKSKSDRRRVRDLKLKK